MGLRSSVHNLTTQSRSMFQTFSGSTRRPRQVNLSGRGPSGFGSVGSGAGSQAALDRAQQERQQRQRERDRLRAAKLIQRIWRSYSSRQQLHRHLREEWDQYEKPSRGLRFGEPYTSVESFLQQMQRLARFARSGDNDDVWRVVHFGHRLIVTADKYGLVQAATMSREDFVAWNLGYTRIQRLTLRMLYRLCDYQNQWDSCSQLLILLKRLAEETPERTQEMALEFYRTLAHAANKVKRSWARSDGADKEAYLATTLITDTAISPLKIVTSHTLHAYEVFGACFLTAPPLTQTRNTSQSIPLLDCLASSVNHKLMASALDTLISTRGFAPYKELAHVQNRLRLLACFVYIHRHAHNFNTPRRYASDSNFVSVVSALLNSLPRSIIEYRTKHTNAVQDVERRTLGLAENTFLEEQILSLVNEDSVRSLLKKSASPELSQDEKIEEARQLANYALALLRFFPSRSDEIRMWLYLGPKEFSSQDSSQSLPAIRYFWEAMKRTSIFGTITRDSRAAIDLLSAKLLMVTHDYHEPNAELRRPTRISDEWRVILIFLELYTFILKIMDDEEFFSGNDIGYTSRISGSSTTRGHALPLAEVKELATFLKNLGFTLYFNAADLAASVAHKEREPFTSISNGTLAFEDEAALLAAEEDGTTAGSVAGLSLDYVKHLVTSLLRSLYERDSRRKFLPADHWVMNSRFDMAGLIPAVVQEEENRHRIEEEDAEDGGDDDLSDLEDDMEDADQLLVGTSRAQQTRRLERLQREQRKASRRRHLQAVAPRLEILQNMPFLIPFATRVQIFREFVSLDMTQRRGSVDAETWRVLMMNRPDAPQQFEKHHAQIRRGHEFIDAFEQFYPLGQGLKEPIQITFVDQFEQPEAGIDGGGVTKEFLTSVTNKAFNPSEGIDLFIDNDQHLLYPNPAAVEEQKELLRQHGLHERTTTYRLKVMELLQRYEFMGRIIGKCLYEGILVDINFAPFFLRKWALTGGNGSKESGYRATLNDLRDLDEDLYQGLHQLKNYTGDVENDFSLNFTVTDTFKVDHDTGATKTITKELKPGGSDIPVDNQNRLVYISYVARHRLQNEPYQQTAAFLKGLSTMIQPSWLSMFNHSELQTLLGGTSSSIDLDDLRRNTVLGGVYQRGDDGRDHPTIELFWHVMEKLNDGERRAVLKFVTSTPRSPLLGFGTLRPPFSIRDAGNDQERLPSTSTCVNLLKLPIYRDESVLREKLLYSVFSGAGFDLS